MTDPIHAYSTDFGRFYKHPASRVGEHDDNPSHRNAPKPSITNIIGMMDKKFLPPLHARLVAEYAVENLEGIKYQVDTFGADYAIGQLKAVAERPHPNAAIGDEIHAHIDAFITKGVTPEDFGTVTAQNMWRQWEYFYAKHKPEILRTEYTVWSYRYGYAGTGDLLWRDHHGTWIIDTKSGNRVYPTVGMQTAALKFADVIISADGSELPMIPTDLCGVMHIRPRSIKLYELHQPEVSLEAFLACKRLLDWVRFDEANVITYPRVMTEMGNDVYTDGDGKPKVPAGKLGILSMGDQW